MLIILKKESTLLDIEYIEKKLLEQNISCHYLKHNDYPLFVSKNISEGNIEIKSLESLSFIEKVVRIDKAYTLASREYRKEDSIIKIGDKKIGEGFFQMIAGPCAVENEEQIVNTARFLKEQGISLLRGGAYKPRTSPYSFQGLGLKGLELLNLAKKETGLSIVSEIVDVRDLETMLKYVDVLQVGSRNMHNYVLLKELSNINKPVILKRGYSSTIEEWLLSAEYILAGGNDQVILCERGIRTFEKATRNTLDISAVPMVKELSHLPIIVDPSHGTGKWNLVSSMSKAAVAAGCDGLMVEVHPNPEVACSDGEQSLNFKKFKLLMDDIKKISEVL